MAEEQHGRIAKHSLIDHGGFGSDHHPWASRDYLDIDCQAVGCMYNHEKKCGVPSLCVIGDDGRCTGFKAKPLPKKIDGD